ncbi:MAG TPA: hypothetical protein VE957_19260 [Terriglobales bacterium]|nr:hypothetical protein [Terriglobales bacterium]
MVSNLERYKKDVDSLVARGENLHNVIQAECFPEKIRNLKRKVKDYVKTLPSFHDAYQPWYSEAKVLVKQLLPDRLSDFVRHYEKPTTRKDLNHSNYVIEDYLQGVSVTRGNDFMGKEKVVGPDSAIPRFRQQLAILKSVSARFESSLFDIRQLEQADLFDSELDAAEELARKRFTRAAGALAGVVLERHLAQVCENHAVKITKKGPTISDLNDALKGANAIDIPQWRFVQHLGDIRNLCDHDKKAEPTPEQVSDLIAGVKKTIKTLF